MTNEASLDRLLEGLSRPDAYPHETDGVRTLQTHISAVFLAGPHAYKVKKPVHFDFVDFSTLERRRRFCHAEVRLNRRLAPSVYHGVVPIVDGPQGLRALDVVLEGPSDSPPQGSGQAVEYAVRMHRLPEVRTLKSLLRGGALDGERATDLLERLARLLAEFHAGAERNAEISRIGGFPTIAAHACDNFDELDELVGETVSDVVLKRLRQASGQTLSRLRPLMERRARADVPCDGHGDLRLGHVYHLENGSGTGDIVIIDCVEFNDRFRYADPVADIAFLTMELEFEGRPDLAEAFTDRYLEAAHDADGAELVPYYIAYRDIVRGKVHTLTFRDDTIPEPSRQKAVDRAKRHFLRALGRLAPPDQRPALLLLAGLPGVGKSALARVLADDAGFVWIDTDRVRKEITAGAVGTGAAAGGGPDRATSFEEGIYRPEWTERTYAECVRRAESLLFEGGRVAVEGSFRTRRHRTALLEGARALGVPTLLLVCEADRDVVRRRLRERSDQDAGEDASDADWRVYEEMERRWEDMGPETAAVAHRIRCDRSLDHVLGEAAGILRRAGLRS